MFPAELNSALNSPEYRKLRRAQSERLHASQLERLSKTFQGLSRQDLDKVADARLNREKHPPGPTPMLPVKIFSQSAPYVAGSPFPTVVIKQPDALGNQQITNVSLGNAAEGQLSVSLYGGNFFLGGFDSPTKPDSLPMPDRWLLGDAISSSASVFQAASLSGAPSKGVLIAGVDFGWKPDVYASEPDVGYGQDPTPNYLGQCFGYLPGTVSSALQGFIGVSAAVEVTATVLSGLEVLESTVIDKNILTLGINARLSGDAFNEGNHQYLFRDFAFDGAGYNNIVSLSTEVPIVANADALVVEASVRLLGLRGGVNDPDAGYIGGGFVSIKPGTPGVGSNLISAPIVVRNISAYRYWP